MTKTRSPTLENRYEKTNEFEELKTDVRLISDMLRDAGLCEIFQNEHWGNSLSTLFQTIKKRIDIQKSIVAEIDQVVVRKTKTNLMFEAITNAQFENLEKRNKLEKQLLKLLRRNAEILLSASLQRHRSSSENKSSEEKEDDETKCIPCLHKYLELWMPMREFHCGQCKIRITDLERLKEEETWIEKIHLEDKEFFIKKKKIDDEVDVGDADAEETLASYHSAKMNNFEVEVNKSSDAAIMRGVTIEWLIDWTNKKDCWNMPTWMVKVKFIVPETAETRCRYSELESSRKSGAFGKADTFVSHCWVRIVLSHLFFIKKTTQ